METPKQQPMNLNIDLSQAKDVVCENCDGIFFETGFMLKMVSKLIAGTDKDALYPVQVFRCMDCGNVNKGFMPQ